MSLINKQLDRAKAARDQLNSMGMDGDMFMRLSGFYAMGPIMPDGMPEFGYRDFTGRDARAGITVEAQELVHKLLDQIPAATAAPTEDLHEALRMAIGQDAYDCNRVWEAWSVGTMTQDDFEPVNDRLDEIVDAVLAVLPKPAPSDGLREAAIKAAVEEYDLSPTLDGDADRHGRRCAVRGMMVRLGLYSEFNAALTASRAQEGASDVRDL